MDRSELIKRLKQLEGNLNIVARDAEYNRKLVEATIVDLEVII